MSKVSELKVGSILSETSFYIVEEVNSSSVGLKDGNGNSINIGNDYVEAILSSADYFKKEEKKSLTDLTNLFISNSRVALTVAFYKKDVDKKKRDFNKEKADKIAEIKSAPVSKIESLLTDLIENPITKVIPGELRVMKGRHYGKMNDLGRIEFVDMESSSTFVKQVDPRTIQYIIVGGIKYSLK